MGGGTPVAQNFSHSTNICPPKPILEEVAERVPVSPT